MNGPLVCNVCDRVFRTVEEMILHEQRYDIKKSYQCDVCSFSFAKIADLRQHKRTLTSGEKLYQCALCEESFSLKPFLKYHLENIHMPRCVDLLFIEKGTTHIFKRVSTTATS